MPVQPNQQTNGFQNIGAGITNAQPFQQIGATTPQTNPNVGMQQTWNNPYYPPSPNMPLPMQYPQGINQMPYQQPVVPAEQTSQQVEEDEGPTLADVMNQLQNITQILNDRIDNLEVLVKKPHNQYRQNGSKQYKKEHNNA